MASSADPFPDHQPPPDRAAAASSASATHDPVLHGHLLHSKYRGAALRNIGSRWRHVVLNIRTGELCLYRVEQDESRGGRELPPEVSVNAKNRCKSELFYLPRKSQNSPSGGSKGKSNKAAALLVGSNLPHESELILRLPSGTWTIKDLVGNDTAFNVKYDLRSVEGTLRVPQAYIQDDDASVLTIGSGQLTKSKGKITLRCPGGGNEKAMWQTAASKCGGIDEIAPELLAADIKAKSSIGHSVSTQSKSALKFLSRSKPVKQLGKSMPKSIQHKNVTWRYRKDFTAVGALNMSVLVQGPLPDSVLDTEMHRSIVQGDDVEDEISIGNVGAGGEEDDKEYLVQPQWAYPNVWMTPVELKREMLRKSDHFHDLRGDDGQDVTNNMLGRRIGSLQVEVLSCHGLSRQETVANVINLSDGSGGAVVYLVAGSQAFCTDTIPGIRDHFWLRKTRRAAIFPIYHPYDHLYAGVFDADTNDFSGRVCLDVAKLRPDSTYNITVPLRQSAQMYTRAGRGVIQLRFKLEWDDQKAAVLSYVPPSLRAQPVSITCGDKVAFRNVAKTVYGEDLHGKWNRKIMKATTKELKLYKKHTKALKKQIISDISGWVNPTFSLYVFVGWMHCVYRASIALALPYFFGFIIMWLVRNYATFVIGSYTHKGYAPPTILELILALFGLKAIRPLHVKKHSGQDPPPMPQRPIANKMYIAAGFKENEAFLDEEGFHLEFPFSDGDRHRKIPMNEAYAKELAPETKPINLLPVSSRANSSDITEHELFTFEDDDENNPTGIEAEENSSGLVSTGVGDSPGRKSAIEHIAPDQDMNVPYQGTTIFQDLDEFLGIAHSATFGVVHDRVVKARKLVVKSFQAKAASRSQLADSSTHSEELDFDIAEDNEPIIATMEKALGIGVQRNPVLQMQQKFCGPVVQIQRVGLIFFRSIFNLFIWSDPYASFWLFCVLVALVIVTAFFPWRLMFFVGGIGFVGPQNWIIRVYKEFYPPSEEEKAMHSAEPVSDTKRALSLHEAAKAGNIVSKTLKKASHIRRKSNEPEVVEDETLAATPRPFTSHANTSTGSVIDALWSSSKGDTALSEVLVPCTPLRQERFYDWPPEPTQSKCKPLRDAKRAAVYCTPQSAVETPSLPNRSNAGKSSAKSVTFSSKISKKYLLKSKRN